MRQEITQYAGEAYDIVKTAANDIGSRLPGSEGEKKFADFMQGKLEDIGVKPVREGFEGLLLRENLADPPPFPVFEPSLDALMIHLEREQENGL